MISGIVLLMMNHQKQLGNTTEGDKNGRRQTYTCVSGPLPYSIPISDSEIITPCQVTENYRFSVENGKITSGFYQADYKFSSKANYNNFYEGKNVGVDLKIQMDTKNLVITYSGELIYPNEKREGKMVYDDNYLLQLKKVGYQCILE